MAAKKKFTRIPKVQELISAGVPCEVIPTYCALADYSNNKSGLCWPKMETLAATLGRSVRTIQRHLHQLQELGLVEFVERRRYKGRFSSYLYRIVAIPSMARRKRRRTTGHGKPVGSAPPIFTRTKRGKTTPLNPPRAAFNWFFGEERDLAAERQYQREKEEAQAEVRKRRYEDYGWLFE